MSKWNSVSGYKSKKYLHTQDRLKLIKDIQSGMMLVKNKQGKIVQKKDKSPFMDKCNTMNILDKLADVSELAKGTYGKAKFVEEPGNRIGYPTRATNPRPLS